jgi:hypothetical protein
MYFLYIIALLAIAVGGILWYTDRNITLQEWLGGGATALGLAIIFNIIIVINIHSKMDDTETWSGQITEARHYSAWLEYYEEAVYRTEYYTTTDSKGHEEEHSRQVFDHWESEHRQHHDTYKCQSDINTSYDIDAGKFAYFVQKFGQQQAVAGKRTTSEHASRMVSGDPNDYVAVNVNHWIEPVTTIKHFENRIKATPNLFQFSKVPSTIKVFPWPNNPDWDHSDRLQGTAARLIDHYQFDVLNTKLGGSKKVNLILIGFGDNGLDYGQYQQAAYLGGKKNDLVMCFGGGSKTNHANWSYVFGYTERDIVKQNLQTLLLDNPINDTLLPKIEAEVRKNYEIKDWKKFNYISVEPNPEIYFWYVGIMLVVQFILYIVFNQKGSVFQRSGYRRNAYRDL